MVEHIAALAVIGCCCVTIATVSATHHEMVVPARDDAYAQQVALTAIRLNVATNENLMHCDMGDDRFTAHVTATQVEVSLDDQTGQEIESWTFVRGVHSH